MHVEFLIIGQGISGTFLSYYLGKNNRKFVIVDQENRNSPSRIAAGIINPVTGRRMVTVWMADEVLPFAWSAYNEIGKHLNIQAISQKNIIDFFPNPFMRENFKKRLDEDNEYIRALEDISPWQQYFNFEFGCGEIRPVYMAHLETLLPAWRQQLREKGLLIEDIFDPADLIVSNREINWSNRNGGNIIAEKVVFCDGSDGIDNPYFKQLPFAPNKGEALIIQVPGLPRDHVFKKSVLVAPLHGEKDLFWVGSNYSWEFPHADPTDEFRNNAENVLKEWLKIPFRFVEHYASIRPATLERRPFVGLHPHFTNIGILNGLGTKGCSLAPFFAKQLVDHLLFDQPLTPEANIQRFQRILLRKEN